MTMPIQESYNAAPLGVDGVFATSSPNSSLGGFLCATAGTMTITSGGVTQIAVAVVAGTFYPLPFQFTGGVTVTLSGGASGLLGWL